MPDVPGFPADETARPPSRTELRAREKEMKALELWMRPGATEAGVAKAMRTTKLQARILINRAAKRAWGEVTDNLDRFRMAQLADMMSVRAQLLEAVQAGDLPQVERLIRTWERGSKLLALDAQKEEAQGNNVIVIDTRPPWEREPEVIDIVPSEFPQKELEPPKEP